MFQNNHIKKIVEMENYLLQERIGKGGTAVVFSAIHKVTKCCIKNFH